MQRLQHSDDVDVTDSAVRHVITDDSSVPVRGRKKVVVALDRAQKRKKTRRGLRGAFERRFYAMTGGRRRDASDGTPRSQSTSPPTTSSDSAGGSPPTAVHVVDGNGGKAGGPVALLRMRSRGGSVPRQLQNVHFSPFTDRHRASILVESAIIRRSNTHLGLDPPEAVTLPPGFDTHM